MPVKSIFISLQVVFTIFCSLIIPSAFSENYVGSSSCKSCHEKPYKEWTGSHHDMSMKHADSQSVLGNFNDMKIDFKGKNNQFYKKGDNYWVNIEGPDSQFNDYQIKYTFGYYPLQQYMVEFDDGRVQLIPFAWDARTKDSGGQRWFHLYPNETDKNDDFFWTNTGQNWNYMCADCHSTNISKNYNVKTNTYNTTFSEINVGCEACHGPAAKHIQWVKNLDKSPNKGFDRTLTKAVNNWYLPENKKTMLPNSKHKTQQLLVCSQCHSRRTQISDKSVVKGNNFGEKYLLSLITQPNYQPDGQVHDEVFVYGSFLQSKMHKSGVSCTNCHNPHTAKLTIPKEAVCMQCHTAENYATKKHHKHSEKSSGAQCVNCHMPATTYMEIDSRRDHSWHVPRSDFSLQLGVKNACLDCHENESNEWFAKALNDWYPDKDKPFQSFAPAFAGADLGYRQVSGPLAHIAQDVTRANIIRASALNRMASMLDQNTVTAIYRGIKDNDHLVRIGAIQGASQMPAKERWRILSPSLTDDILAVRVEATRVISSTWAELTQEQKKQLTPALKEYIDTQLYNADRAFSHTNLGNLYANQGNSLKAINAFNKAIELEPYYTQSYISLAELYRRMRQNDNSLNTLRSGLKISPKNDVLHYQIAMAYIRIKEYSLAQKSLLTATTIAPNIAQYQYVLGVSQQEFTPEAAITAYKKAFGISNNPEHLYAQCSLAVKIKHNGAKSCIEKLKTLVPEQYTKPLEKALYMREK